MRGRSASAAHKNFSISRTVPLSATNNVSLKPHRYRRPAHPCARRQRPASAALRLRRGRACARWLFVMPLDVAPPDDAPPFTTFCYCKWKLRRQWGESRPIHRRYTTISEMMSIVKRDWRKRHQLDELPNIWINNFLEAAKGHTPR